MFKSYEKEGNLGLRVTFYTSFLTATAAACRDAPKQQYTIVNLGDWEAGPCLSQQPPKLQHEAPDLWNQLQKFITILFIIIFTIIFIIYSSGVRDHLLSTMTPSSSFRALGSHWN